MCGFGRDASLDEAAALVEHVGLDREQVQDRIEYVGCFRRS